MIRTNFNHGLRSCTTDGDILHLVMDAFENENEINVCISVSVRVRFRVIVIQMNSGLYLVDFFFYILTLLGPGVFGSACYDY